MRPSCPGLWTGIVLAFVMFPLSATADEQQDGEVRQRVEATERAFAATMADRDFAAFMTFLSEETVFFSGATPLRGKQAVGAAWSSYFQDPEAPFSWEPQQVEVLESGTLALSSGPVLDPGGKHVATFTSIWRREASGEWKIVFDKGNRVCADEGAGHE